MEDKKETIEDFAERLADIPKHLKGQIYKWSSKDRLIYNMVIEGAKWQQERMYSEEEVLELLNDWTEASKEWCLVSKWFEQFKNKQ